VGVPVTRYAQREGINIAYQVFGEGPIDLVLVNGLVAHMDLLWAEPEATAMMRRMGSFARVVLFDKPGTGLSDPVVGAPTIEQRMRDVIAVMDAAGVERGALIGYSEGAFPAALAAATYPDRVSALILASSGARFAQTPDPEFGFEEEISGLWDDIDELACRRWGEGGFALKLAPSWESSEVHRRLAGVDERASASPGMVRAIIDGVRHYDMREFLPAIRVPTLVLHPRDEWIPVAIGRDMAARIPGARFVELPGRDHVPFAGDWRPGVEAIEAFVGGERRDSEPDRVLRTIVFTDIVDSTRRAAEMGDSRWRALLERHDHVVRGEVIRFGGRVVKNLGDGYLIAFEGAARAIRFARAVCAEAADLELQVRAAVHSGECEAIGEDLAGIAVHIGARIAALARPGEVLVSSTVRDLVVGSGITFSARGQHDLKGVPGRWTMYAVAGDTPAEAHAQTRADAATSATPGAQMRPVDRMVMRVARHAPGLARVGLRAARRTSPGNPST
jgi:class 3 adenylate cyclase/alpha-beta hydrolase superfamily lysophospholipase